MTSSIDQKCCLLAVQLRTVLCYFRSLELLALPVLFILISVAGGIVINEFYSSRIQALYFSNVAGKLKYELGNGISPSIRFPKFGPYDQRLGYTSIPEYTRLLTGHEFIVSKQARMSPALLNLKSPVYPEKDQAGLNLLDSKRQSLYMVRSPEQVYANFKAIPKLLVETLLFIEDRELLDARHPMRNPAVNWSRLDRAVFDQLIHAFIPSHEAPGASTLVTQIEKYRHSPAGRTTSVGEKFLQMKSASLRAYLYGVNTMASRRQIAVTYINTVPLSAKAGYGEINGFADGMKAWYGRDFSEINHLLGSEQALVSGEQRAAQTYKQALSLIIAQRRPSYYLRTAPALLQATNSHLRLLAAAGIISPAMLNAALPLPLKLNQGPVNEPATPFVSRKAVNLLRADLSSLLHIPHLYDLDRIDLTVQTTLDGDTQRAVTDMLQQVQTQAGARSAGLYGHNMLGNNDDPARLSFSFTLFERIANANLLRVQTDSLDQPFDINSGARLNLGSTAKLRTLICYLEIIAKLHKSYADTGAKELGRMQPDKQDVLSRWAQAYFAAHPHQPLADTLEAAMMRSYSGNPSEIFFTGGGLQKFENFEPEENNRILTVREGFQHSVNLVFVRLMRDIVRYYEHQTSGAGIQRLANISSGTTDKSKTSATSTNSERQAALSRFADKEGREFLQRFYKKYQGKTADEALQTLIDEVRTQPRQLSIIFRSLEPDANFQRFTVLMHEQLPEAELSKQTLKILYDKFGTDKYSLTDRGYLVGIHPLELWLVSYLHHAPKATLSRVIQASRDQRQEVYAWLFKTHNKKTQDSRIHQMLELEAFDEIATSWRRLGYPFAALTPSYASALGASGDRPASLAELMGIIVNNGVSMPSIKLQSMQFAQGTPYETHLIHRAIPGTRVLPEEIAAIVRRSLFDVVQGGTGIRLKNGFTQPNGAMIRIGGKTGTGDQRFATYEPNGRLIESRAVNRSATFVFEIGDRFFGTVTAYVHEPYAADYKFTSALTVQLLKSLIPALQPVVAQSRIRPDT